MLLAAAAGCCWLLTSAVLFLLLTLKKIFLLSTSDSQYAMTRPSRACVHKVRIFFFLFLLQQQSERYKQITNTCETLCICVHSKHFTWYSFNFFSSSFWSLFFICGVQTTIFWFQTYRFIFFFCWFGSAFLLACVFPSNYINYSFLSAIITILPFCFSVFFLFNTHMRWWYNAMTKQIKTNTKKKTKCTDRNIRSSVRGITFY